MKNLCIMPTERSRQRVCNEIDSVQCELRDHHEKDASTIRPANKYSDLVFPT